MGRTERGELRYVIKSGKTVLDGTREERNELNQEYSPIFVARAPRSDGLASAAGNR